MTLRTPLAAIYAVFMMGAASTGVSPAQAIPVPAGQGSVTSVSGIAPTSNGNVPFGCPLSPFSAGTNMSVNQMDGGCALHYAGPNETQAQSTIDIAALSATVAANYVSNSSLSSTLASYTTSTALVATLANYSLSSAIASTYLTQANAASTYCAIATCPSTSAMNTAIAAAAYTFVAGSPNTRTVSLATAYQATTTTKSAIVNVTLSSTAAISLSGGATNAAKVYIGSTNAVASGTGTPICSYANSNTGTLTIGLNISTIATTPCSFILPSGWYFAVVVSTGTVTVASTYDQSAG